MRVSNSTGENGLSPTLPRRCSSTASTSTPLTTTLSAGRDDGVLRAGQRAGRRHRGTASFANATIERATGLGDVVRVVLGSDYRAVALLSPSGSRR